MRYACYVSVSLNPRSHIKKLGRVTLLCNPRAGTEERGNHQGLLASQESLLCKFPISMGPGLEKQDLTAPEEPHPRSVSDLHTCAQDTHINRKVTLPPPHNVSLSLSLSPPPFFSLLLYPFSLPFCWFY